MRRNNRGRTVVDSGEPNEITTRADVLSLDGTDPHKIHIYI